MEQYRERGLIMENTSVSQASEELGYGEKGDFLLMPIGIFDETGCLTLDASGPDLLYSPEVVLTMMENRRSIHPLVSFREENDSIATAVGSRPYLVIIQPTNAAARLFVVIPLFNNERADVAKTLKWQGLLDIQVDYATNGYFRRNDKPNPDAAGASTLRITRFSLGLKRMEDVQLPIRDA